METYLLRGLFKTARHILLNRLPDNLVFPSDNWIFPP